MIPDDIAEYIESRRRELSELEKELSSPDIYGKPAECKRLSRERTLARFITESYDSWCKALRSIKENQDLLQTETDGSFLDLLRADIEEQQERAATLEHTISVSLIPPDKADTRDTIIEIRPAAGGEEAALFAGEMFRMFTHYAERKGWKCEIMESTASDLGGIKGAVFSLSGDDVYSSLKYESGVHRVQRVPVTEAGGRIHTSTITVAVFPEADEMDDIVIRPEDLEISTYRSSGPGGQHVNKTDSAVRIVHKPSGIVTASQQERSQPRNKEIALRILRAKLLEIQTRAEAEKQAECVRRQVGTGDRSERIRTYNFPQNRVTDHRFGVSCFNLPGLLEGDLDLILVPIREEVSRRILEQLKTDKAIRNGSAHPSKDT